VTTWPCDEFSGSPCYYTRSQWPIYYYTMAMYPKIFGCRTTSLRRLVLFSVRRDGNQV